MVAAEEAAALLGPDDADLAAVLADGDLVGVAAGDRHVGLGGLGRGDGDRAAADLDEEVDGLGGVEVVVGHGALLREGVFVRGTGRCRTRVWVEWVRAG